jgi:secreted trypsin-like serine protease
VNLALAAVVVSFAASATPVSGRLVVGHPVPGVVALVNARAAKEDIYNAQFCGGVLIDPMHVLTAAHCVAGRPAGSIDAVVGADNLCRGRPIDGDRIPVAEVSVDPRYDVASGRFDLARLTLDRAVPDESVRVLSDTAPDAGNAIAFGWGRGSPGGVPSCRLQAIVLRLIGPGNCRMRLGTDATALDSDSMLCALPSGAEWEDTCAGDSGGPLILGGEPETGAVIGIVSWGLGCGGGRPSVYARAVAWR